MEKLEYNENLPLAVTEKTFEETFQDVFIDLNAPDEPPKILLSIGEHHYGTQTFDNPTLTLGEFSSIVAPSKTKKTFKKSALVAAVIGGNANNYFDNMRSFYDQEGYIFDIDTEQGPYYAKKAMQRVVKMVGSHHPKYMPFGLRKLSESQRLHFIDELVERYSKKGKIALMVIDGIADLCVNVNDIEQSKEVIIYLEKWTAKGMHILNVIHKNFSNEKATGHLGTYVQKKCETIIKLENMDEQKRNPPIKVTQSYSRGPRFEPYYFKLNEHALPEKCEEEENENWT